MSTGSSDAAGDFKKLNDEELLSDFEAVHADITCQASCCKTDSRQWVEESFCHSFRTWVTWNNKFGMIGGMCWDRFGFLWTLYRAYERVSGAAAAATSDDIEQAAGPEVQPEAVQLHAAMTSSTVSGRCLPGCQLCSACQLSCYS